MGYWGENSIRSKLDQLLRQKTEELGRKVTSKDVSEVINSNEYAFYYGSFSNAAEKFWKEYQEVGKMQNGNEEYERVMDILVDEYVSHNGMPSERALRKCSFLKWDDTIKLFDGNIAKMTNAVTAEVKRRVQAGEIELKEKKKKGKFKNDDVLAILWKESERLGRFVTDEELDQIEGVAEIADLVRKRLGGIEDIVRSLRRRYGMPNWEKNSVQEAAAKIAALGAKNGEAEETEEVKKTEEVETAEEVEKAEEIVVEPEPKKTQKPRSRAKWNKGEALEVYFRQCLENEGWVSSDGLKKYDHLPPAGTIRRLFGGIKGLQEEVIRQKGDYGWKKAKGGRKAKPEEPKEPKRSKTQAPKKVKKASNDGGKKKVEPVEYINFTGKDVLLMVENEGKVETKLIPAIQKKEGVYYIFSREQLDMCTELINNLRCVREDILLPDAGQEAKMEIGQTEYLVVAKLT